jgi:hypothetical protein
MLNSTGDRKHSRREFAVKALTALIWAAIITASACDSDTPAHLTVGPGDSGTDRTGTISNNHGHVATVTAAELIAGNALSLDIRGSADHSHIVSVNATEVTQIRAGQRVTVTSTTDASATFGPHSHTVTFN